MSLFPITTIEDAIGALQRAFECEAVVQDATESLYHGIEAVNEAGTLYREGDEIGTFAILHVTCRGVDQVVGIRIGAVGELCADPETRGHFESWAKALEPSSSPEKPIGKS